MKLTLIIAAAAFAAGTTAVAEPTSKEPNQLFAIGSWGDLLACYGPGTDPSMDTPQAIENMITYWKARGYQGAFIRTDLGQLGSMIRKNPITMTSQATQAAGNSDPRTAWLYKYIDRVQEDFDFHRVGTAESDKLGFEWWAWHPHIYSDGAPETAGGPGPGRIWPWTYVSTYKFEHPEIISIDRHGTRMWHVREYGYPGARESMVAEFVHMAKTLGVKRFIACMRTECSQIQDPPDKADQFGFNQVVVDDMKRLHNIDILTDSRFDVDSPSFDPKDPALEKWRDLRGSYVTELYRSLRKSLREVDPTIQLAVTLSGDHVGPPLGNWRLDWKTWVDEGLVDMIITPVFFEANIDPEAATKGYLTHARENIGTVEYKALKDYITHSKHPDIRVIATGAAPYEFVPAAAGADGWRVDMWYSAYTLAWYQRWWKQCVKDIETNGSLAFFKQNFDGFPINSSGHAGGWGSFHYDPVRHACEGTWFTLGDGTDAKPVATTEVRRGAEGAAIKITAADTTPQPLIGIHRSFPDRSGIFASVDNAITNGTAEFEFWVYRADADSGLTAFLQDSGRDYDVGLRIAPGSGSLSYSTGVGASPSAEPEKLSATGFAPVVTPDTSHVKWAETGLRVPVGHWQRLAIRVDIDSRVYHGFAGEGPDAKRVWGDTPIQEPSDRFFIHPNENIPIKVPSYKMFRQVQFIPEGKAGAHCYLDDVAVHWTPALYYTRPRGKLFFADDFERQQVDRPINNARTNRGGMWTTTSDAGAQAFTVTNDTSFGEGVKALVASAGGVVVAKGEPLRHIPNSYITVDLDVFIRSDKEFPYITPDPTTTSTHWSMVGLRRKGSDDCAAVALASRGTWWLWDGSRYVDTGKRVTYDVWNHLQLAIDAPTGRYKLVTQPIGEMPSLIGQATLGESIVINTDLEFFIQTSDTQGHLSLYDNVSITAGARP